MLILAEAALVFGAIVGAVYLRVGMEGAAYELITKVWLLESRAGDVLLSGRLLPFRPLRLRCHARPARAGPAAGSGAGSGVDGAGLSFYAFPQLMLGRGIALIALPLALA